MWAWSWPIGRTCQQSAHRTLLPPAKTMSVRVSWSLVYAAAARVASRATRSASVLRAWQFGHMAVALSNASAPPSASARVWSTSYAAGNVVSQPLHSHCWRAATIRSCDDVNDLLTIIVPLPPRLCVYTPCVGYCDRCYLQSICLRCCAEARPGESDLQWPTFTSPKRGRPRMQCRTRGRGRNAATTASIVFFASTPATEAVGTVMLICGRR